MPEHDTTAGLPRRRRRIALAAAVTGALLIGSLGLGSSPAGAAPESFVSTVEGNISVKGDAAEFTGVTITGTFDETTGDLTARASFPPLTVVQEDVFPGIDAEVHLEVSQPNVGTGTIVDGVANLDASFRIVLTSLYIVDANGNRTPQDVGGGACVFAPINVVLVGTATGSPLAVEVSDPNFTIPAPNAANCGPLGSLIIPAIAGSPNSAELRFTLSSVTGQVQTIYQAVLGRGADEAGLAHWTARLEAGDSPTLVATRIARSREGWRNAVRDTYVLSLNRSADPDGLAFWTDALLRDQDQSFLVGRHLSSPEFDAQARSAYPSLSPNAAFVSLLYQRLFNRAVDEPGLAFWTARLDAASNQAVARTQVAQRLYRNNETVRAAVRAASTQVCGAPATGAHFDTLAAAFVASNYHTRVLLAVASVTPCPAAPM